MFIKSMDGRLTNVLMKLKSKEFNKAEEVAEYMNISVRTVHNYVKKLNEIMKNETAEIINVNGKGYKLKIYDENKFQGLISCVYKNNVNLQENPILNTPEDRRLYILSFLIKNSNKIIKIDDLSAVMNIGRTTLTNDLKKVKSLLKIYNIKLLSKTNSGIKIQGDELNIRMVILNSSCKGFNTNGVLWNKYKDKHEIIKVNIMNIFEKNNFNTIDENLDRILNYILVMIVRTKQNNPIKIVEDKYYQVMKTKEYNIALNIKEMLEQVLKIKFENDEILFLTLPLVSCEASASSNDVELSDNIISLIKKIVAEINYEFGVSIDIDDEITKNLGCHLKFMINRLIFNVRIKNMLTKDIKRNYPLSFEMGKVAGNLIGNDHHLEVSEDEIAYLALYFQSYIEKNKLTNYNIKKIALVCGTGLGTAQLLKIKLKNLFSEDVVFDIFSDTQLENEILNQYNMVFTTINLNVKIKVPLIKVNALFNEDDLRRN
ncbi:BglG family transcription antiterminator [Clostridium guangxiense]|uniref:BglG family transcription antiterminator n=1 Tax=Clostridium guangxiense TaxID=1662055 RepID=UPI001E355C62|nr:transcription antiterminator [Clostridium guangxiense]MCD2345455.1 transcription antiterminator [Clostridium guangxiense]